MTCVSASATVIELPKRPGLKPGDQVRILQGPFAGRLGLYAGMRPHERVLVLLALLGGQQRVELPKDDVEPGENCHPNCHPTEREEAFLAGSFGVATSQKPR